MTTTHTRDEHCDVKNGGCDTCGADHSGPACLDCGGVAYHADGCPATAAPLCDTCGGLTCHTADCPVLLAWVRTPAPEFTIADYASERDYYRRVVTGA